MVEPTSDIVPTAAKKMAEAQDRQSGKFSGSCQDPIIVFFGQLGKSKNLPNRSVY